MNRLAKLVLKSQFKKLIYRNDDKYAIFHMQRPKNIVKKKKNLLKRTTVRCLATDGRFGVLTTVLMAGGEGGPDF